MDRAFVGDVDETRLLLVAQRAHEFDEPLDAIEKPLFRPRVRKRRGRNLRVREPHPNFLERPFLDTIERMRQPVSGFLWPFGERRQKTIELEREQCLPSVTGWRHYGGANCKNAAGTDDGGHRWSQSDWEYPVDVTREGPERGLTPKTGIGT